MAATTATPARTSALVARRAPPRRAARRVAPCASAPAGGSTTSTEEAGTRKGKGHGHGMMKKEDGFLGELRSYAMKLHTREQAPKEGQAEAPKEQPKWEPTTECYLQYLVDSKCVYDTLEKAVAEAEEGSALVAFKATGLERGEALARDIAWFTSAEGDGLGLEAPAVSEVGSSYAATLAGMARDNVPAFMCHYYNTYFAHTAGGRMIGKQLSDAILDKKKLEFYKWDGVLKEHMDGVRKEINAMAEKWTQEEKQACLEETGPCFKEAGKVLRLLAGQ